MKAWLAGSLGLWVSSIIAQSATQMPPWVVLLGSLFGTGVLGRYLLTRYEKRWEQRLQDATAAAQEAAAKETDAKTRVALDDLQQKVIDRARAQYAEMAAEVERTKTKLAEAHVEIAANQAEIARLTATIEKRDTRARQFRTEIERLHDQVAALEKGRTADRRRRDDAPAEEPPPELG